MSVPAPATAGPPPAQTHAKTSTAILQGADAIMALFSEEIAKATQQYQQQVQDLERQLATTISVFESTTAALEQLRKERDNAVAAAQYASEDRRKAVEEKDGLQRELQDATVREEVAGVAARRRDTILLAHQASLDAHRKDKLARDNLVNQLTSDISTLTDTIRDEKAKGEAEAAAKEKAHQALRREMDSCAYRLRQDVAKVATERDAALAEVAEMKETATTLQSSITSLEAERDAARAEVQKRSDEADELRCTQASFKEAAATAEAERDDATRKLTERLASFELAAASLTTERDGARAEVQKHLEELSIRATRISELEADKAKSSLIPDLQEELARQGAILIQRDSQLAQLKDAHTKTLAKLSQLEKEKAEADVLVEDLQKKCSRHLPILAQRDVQIIQLKETHAKAIEKLETAMSDEKDRVKRSEQDHKKRLLQRDGTISRMQSQAGRLNTDLTSAQSDIERLQSEKESVEGLLKAAVAEQARAEAAVAAHVKQLSERDAEIAKLQDKGQLSELQEKVKSLESDLDSRAATISQLEADKAGSPIDDQKEKLERQDEMLSQRDEQISRLKQSNGKIRTKLDATRTALADKKSRAQEAEEAQTKLLSERDDTISDLQTRLASTQSDISRLESEKQTVEDVLQTVVAERARAEASLATHAKLLSKRDEEIAKLHDDSELPRALEKAKSLESALAQAHEEKAKLSRKATRLLGEVDRLQVALGSSKKSASEKQAADVVLQRVVAERSRAETAVTSLTSERDALKEQLSTIEAEIKTLREQASTSRVPVLEQNVRERDKRITELQNAIAASKNHIVHLQTSATDEKARLWKQLEVVSAERSAAQTALAALKSEGPSQVSALQRQVKALTEERDALRKTPAALIQERDVLVGKVRERDEAIEKVRLHIPPQIVALEAEVRRLGEERDALQAQAHNVQAVMSALRDEVGLVFSISDNTFSIGERCVPVLTHLIELGQRVQGMCGALAVAQGDLTGDDDGEGEEGTTILALDELHPFSLLGFLGIVRDWMGAAVKTGEGWERMYGETVKEAVKLREQRNRDRARVERTERLERSLKAKSEEMKQFKAVLEKEGIVYDDKDKGGGHGGFVFTGKLLECVKEIAPCVAGVMRTGRAVQEVYQDERVKGLLGVEDTDPRTPMGVLRQMRKWMGVAAVVCEVVWERCGVLERERVGVGRKRERVKDKDKSEAPASMSRESLADITTRSAPKRASTSVGSSASARVSEPPKKKRKIMQESASSSSTQKAVAKEEEEEEDELMALARVLSAPSSRNGKGKGKEKRPVPVPIPWSSSKKPPPSKG